MINSTYERSDRDFYESPEHAISDLLNHTTIPLLHGGKVLDAGCGSGRLSIPLALAGYEVTGIDLEPQNVGEQRQAGVNVVASDVLSMVDETYGTIVSNPPYHKSICSKFVRHCMTMLVDSGTLRLLLPWAWWAAKDRADLLPHVAEALIVGRYKMRPPGAADKGLQPVTDYAWVTLTKEPSQTTRIVRV